MLGVLVEPMLLLGLWVPHRLPVPPTSATSPTPFITGAEPKHPAGAGALCLCVRHFFEMGKLPFDLAEAEQELQEGRSLNTAAAALAS